MSGIKLWINEKGVSEQIENQRHLCLACMFELKAIKCSLGKQTVKQKLSGKCWLSLNNKMLPLVIHSEYEGSDIAAKVHSPP